MWLLFSLCLSANAERPPEDLFREGMIGLSTWSLSNFATSAGPAMYTTDPEWQAYHQMNIGWNTVNLALATSGLLRKTQPKPKSLARIFWINCALDVAYIAGGFLLRQKGIAQDNPQWRGWGSSIALQGSFLLVFDGVMGFGFQQYE